MKEIITRGCYHWGLAPTPEALGRMESFSHMLVEKNEVMNLTAITDPKEIARRHFLDCLFLLTVENLTGKRVIDVGCGAGFPSMPLLCYDPGLDITALDSTGKRIDFVLECCKALQLDITALACRAEEQARENAFREAFDVAVSRAVAPLNILAELCLPFVKVGGCFLAMKGEGSAFRQELEEAHKAIETLGGKVDSLIPYDISGLDARRQILVIHKLSPTPQAYPRRFAKIKEKPL